MWSKPRPQADDEVFLQELPGTLLFSCFAAMAKRDAVPVFSSFRSLTEDQTQPIAPL
jgi:hypothetical protein